LKHFVLDASVSLGWFLDSPVPDLAVRVRRRLESGSVATVPSLWRLEVANGFAVAGRRGVLTAALADRCLDDIEGLMASVIRESAIGISLRQVLSVARTFRLSSYDAVYLETARRELLPLATLNRALGDAALKVGIPLFR